MRFLLPLRLVAALAFVVALAECGWAQYPYQPPTQRPAVSPYLNLLRRGNSTAFNYYTLVRPQVQQLSVNAQQNAAISQLNSQVQSQSTGGGVPQQATGHATSFLNYSHYFPGIRGASAGRR
jgi:hypothetical protein